MLDCRVADSGRPRNRYNRPSSSRAPFLDSALSSDAEKWAVERAAHQQVQGVKGLAEEITIKLNGLHARTSGTPRASNPCGTTVAF